MSEQDLRKTLESLIADARRLQKEFEYYWSPEGENVAQLEIFIDPDLYQYIERIYKDAQAFFARV
ncbi:MAG: hypothetical protein GXO55_10380, partial [Chloroflexi bacterium]|nr:hypothetical protein [Chloroflexota bacterium]